MATSSRTRILIADDSAVMRSLLRTVIATDGSLEIAGTAADGEAALDALERLHPDLVLLDVEMPVLDGLATLRTLRKRGHKIPVVMCSSLTQRGAKVTLDALAAGASDYVAKPVGQEGRDAAMQALVRELIPRIHALTSQAPAPAHPFCFSGAAPPPALPARTLPASWMPGVIAIGISTGGPAALDVLLPSLPSSFPLPVLIVQHMPELFTGLLANRLNARCPLQVRQAAEGDALQAGNIYIARGNWHMEVLAGARAGAPATLHLTQGPPENYCRPAVDVMFRSAASVHGAGVLAVVMTGMGSDGLLGCRAIRDRGGCVLAQDRSTSAVWGMPGAVAQAGLAHSVLPLSGLAPEILRLATRLRQPAAALRGSVA